MSTPFWLFSFFSYLTLLHKTNSMHCSTGLILTKIFVVTEGELGATGVVASTEEGIGTEDIEYALVEEVVAPSRAARTMTVHLAKTRTMTVHLAKTTMIENSILTLLPQVHHGPRTSLLLELFFLLAPLMSCIRLLPSLSPLINVTELLRDQHGCH